MKKKLSMIWISIFLCLISQIYVQTALAQSTILTVDAGTPSTFLNRENNYVGTVFTRGLKINNPQQASQSFTGYVKIKETDGASLAVNIKVLPNAKVTVVSPSDATTIAAITSPTGYDLPVATTNEIVLRVVNFNPVSDRIDIVETVKVTACLLSGTGVNKSSVSTYLVSTTDTNLPLDSDYQLIQGGQYDQDVNQGTIPSTESFNLNTNFSATNEAWGNVPLFEPSEFLCVDNSQVRKMKQSFRKVTDANFTDATLHNFNLLFSNDAVLYTIDKASIKIEKRSSTNVLLQQWTSQDLVGQDWDPSGNYLTKVSDPASCLSDDRKFSYGQIKLGDILPGEYINIEYDLYNCCKKTDLFDGSILQSNNYVSCNFTDDCGNQGSNTMGPNSSYWNRGLYMTATTNSSPSTMAGPTLTKTYPDVGNFVVDNPPNPNGYAYANVYGGNPFNIDPQTSELVIRISTGESVRYTSYTNSGSTRTPLTGIYPHGTNPGHFVYYPNVSFINKFNSALKWEPENYAGTVISSGATEVREFRFRLKNMPEITSTSTNDDILYGFYSELANYQLTFSLEGICSASDDGSWSVEYLMNISDCSSCLLPVTKVNDMVDVVCPGCKVPGAAARGNAQRSMYGPLDLDNDGLPDNNKSYDFNGDQIPDLVLNETENSTHTLQEILNIESLMTDPSTLINTTFVSAGDNVTFTPSFYLTSPTDCPSTGRTSCKDNELTYKWAYMQVSVPKGYLNGTFSNLSVNYTRSGSTTTVAVPASSIDQVFFTEYSAKDIYYLKINITDVGQAASDYFLSGDRFSISFESNVIKNVTDRDRERVSYMGYFTRDEEDINVLKTTNPDLFNRSYADCSTDELRGMEPTCNTGTLQMICESDFSFLVFVPISTNYNGWYTGYTQDKSCVKYAKSNRDDSYAGEYSVFGLGNDGPGTNVYKNEFRKAPIIQELDIVIPRGYRLGNVYIASLGDAYNFTQAAMTSAQQTLNNKISQDRVMTIDLSNEYMLYDPSNPNNPTTPLKYTDESFNVSNFQVILIPDCAYLISNGITQTYMSRITLGGQTVYSTLKVNNSYVGTNGVFTIGNDYPTQTPKFDTDPFEFDKLNAEGNKFKLQKKVDFVNEFNFRSTIPSTDNIDTYGGEMFFAIDPVAISKYFSAFKIETPSQVLVDWTIGGTNNQTFGISTSVPTDIKVSGKIDLNGITINCGLSNQALYDIIYGIHCNDADITAANILNNNLCNEWRESIELDLDVVDMALNVNIDPGQPVLSNNTVTHTAVFTALRAQITNLQIDLTTTPGATTTVKSVVLYKNSGNTSTDKTMTLTAGTQYTLSPDNNTIIINMLPLTDADGGIIYESPTDGDNYYNEVRVTFDEANSSCLLNSLSTVIKGTATPFYSSTLCKTILQNTVTGALSHNNKPTPAIDGPTVGCVGDNVPLNASLSSVSGTIDYPVSYTWSPALSTTDAATGSVSSGIFTYDFIMPANNVTMKLSVTDVNGCQGTITKTINYSLKPTVTLSANMPTDYCTGSTPMELDFYGSPAGGTYSGDGVSYNTTNGKYYFTKAVAGNYVITYSYSNSAGCTGTASKTIKVENCCRYAIRDINVQCGNSDEVCVELYVPSNRLVDVGVKGLDFYFDYNPNLMTPETDGSGIIEYQLGNVVLDGGATTIANAMLTLPTVTPVNVPAGYKRMYGSIYYTATASAGMYFNKSGNNPNGSVICVKFKINGAFTTNKGGLTYNIFAGNHTNPGQGWVDDEHTLNTINSCVDNNGVGKINILKNYLLNGTIVYHHTTTPLRYNSANPSQYLITEFKPARTGCVEYTTVEGTPDLNGAFSVNMYDAAGTPQQVAPLLKVTRDIKGDYYTMPTCTETSPVIDESASGLALEAINGYDTYLMECLSTFRTTGIQGLNSMTTSGILTSTTAFPTIYQMVAADVNTNGTIRANDITLVQERAVQNICEYPQVWNYTNGTDPDMYPTAGNKSYDWKFMNDISLTDPNYAKSGKYPYAPASTGYWRDNVPVVPACLQASIINNATCKVLNDMHVYSVLLGDLDGNWVSNVTYGKNLKVASAENVVFDYASMANMGNGIYRIPVSYTSDSTIVSVDFNLNYDESKISIVQVGKYTPAEDAEARLMYNDLMKKQLLFTSYTMSYFPKGNALYYVDVHSKDGNISPSDLGSGNGYLNGRKVPLNVRLGETTAISKTTQTEGMMFDVLPNPVLASSKLVYNTASYSDKCKIVVYNSVGQIVNEFLTEGGKGEIPFEAKQLSSGVYTAILYVGENMLTKRFVIEK